MLICFYSNGSDVNYYIDDVDFSIYRGGKYGKLLGVDVIKGKMGACAKIQCHLDKETGRLRIRNTYLSYIVGRYVFKMKRKYVFEFKDGDIYNFTPSNVNPVYLTDLCPNWRRVEESHYYVSSSGLVYDDKNSLLLTPIKDSGGYFYCNFNKKRYKRSQLVWEYFGNCEVKDGYVIDHIDNVPSNDDISNLQCITIRENIIKDKPKRDLPIGVVKKNDGKYSSKIGYTLNGIHYSERLGTYQTAELASAAYNRALSMVEAGIDPIKRGENSNIKYSFSDDTWYFRCPRESGLDKLFKGFVTYDSAEKAYAENVKIDISNETPIEKCLRKGVLFLKYNDEIYAIRKKNGEKSFIKTVERYLECKKNKKMNEFIDEIPMYQEMIDDEDSTYSIEKAMEKENVRLLLSEKDKIKRQERFENELKRKLEHERKKINFADNNNYKKNPYNDAYTFDVPYSDGKRYYLASFMSTDIVNEIDGIMNQHKYTDSFIEWFEWFKESELPKYIERDKAARSLNYNKKVGNKGYGWFSPKNCWRCKRRVNNKEYLLGYFHNEECCKYMNDEFEKALAAGNVEGWYSNIELHKAYARALFKDESINVNHVASKLSAVGFLEHKVTGKKNKEGVDEKYLVKHDSTVDNRNEFNMVQSKSVVQMLNGEVVNTFYSINEAAKFMGGENKSTYISLCCRGIKPNYKGFEWKFI